MEMNVPNLDRLLVTTAVSVESLDQFLLKPQQLHCIAAVDRNEGLVHMVLTLSQKSDARETRGNNLHGQHRLEFRSRPNGAKDSERSVKRGLLQAVNGVWS